LEVCAEGIEHTGDGDEGGGAFAFDGARDFGGLAEISKTTVAPRSGGTKRAMNWPKTWLSGTRVTKRSG